MFIIAIPDLNPANCASADSSIVSARKSSLGKAAKKVITQIQHNPHKEDFELFYVDNNRKEHFSLNAAHLVRLEKETLVFKLAKKKQEIFVPVHRLVEITCQGKPFWRL